MTKIVIHIEDNSQEVLDALKNAVERGAMAIGERAVAHATDNITRQGAGDTGNLRDHISYMVKEE